MNSSPCEWPPSAAPSSPDIIVRTNKRGVILSVSATCSVLGYERYELVGKNGLDLVHPDDRERYVDNTASLYDGWGLSTPMPRLHRFRRRDGSWAWLRGNPRMLAGANGDTGELLNFFEPVSEEVALDALREHEKRQR